VATISSGWQRLGLMPLTAPVQVELAVFYQQAFLQKQVLMSSALQPVQRQGW
jgi:hypothetical protein